MRPANAEPGRDLASVPSALAAHTPGCTWGQWAKSHTQARAAADPAVRAARRPPARHGASQGLSRVCTEISPSAVPLHLLAPTPTVCSHSWGFHVLCL